MKFFNSLLSIVAALSLSQVASAEEPFVSQIEAQPKQLLLKKLNDLLPSYIRATDLALRDISKMSDVNDSTSIGEIPNEVFQKRNSILIKSGAFDDVAFGEGRQEEDVAWLKNSSVKLKELKQLVKRSLKGETVDSQLDLHLGKIMNRSAKNPNGMNVVAIINSVSRFYCNVEVSVSQEPGEKQPVSVSALESCD